MRHGEGMDDVENRYGGWGDLPLSDNGRKQVKDTIEKLKHLKIEKLLSSPLSRAFGTAEIIADGLGLQAEKWLYLKERNTYGLMCGERKEDIEKNYPELLQAYETGEWVPGSESVEDVIKRLRIMLKKIQKFQAGTVLAVTHGNWLKAFCKEFLGKELDKKDDCCILGIEVEEGDIEVILQDGISFKNSLD